MAVRRREHLGLYNFEQYGFDPSERVNFIHVESKAITDPLASDTCSDLAALTQIDLRYSLRGTVRFRVEIINDCRASEDLCPFHAAQIWVLSAKNAARLPF